MFADLAVADGEFLAEPQVLRIHNGLSVESAKEELALLVAALDAYPHPFAGKARNICCKFNFHVVAAIILCHAAPRKLVV